MCIPSIRINLPCCYQENDSELETYCSKAIRITAIFFGIVFILVGSLILAETLPLPHSILIGGVLTALGIHICLIGIFLKSVSQVHQLNNPDIIPSPQQPERKKDLKIEAGATMTMGQGEYIVFHQQGDKITFISKETHKKIYPILNEYAPIEMAYSDAVQDIPNRYELLEKRIKQIDPSLEVVFIPRTLYELNFVTATLQEDIASNSLCPIRRSQVCGPLQQETQIENENFWETHKKKKKERRCWHIDSVSTPGGYHRPGIQKTAYRLNQLIVTKYMPTKKGFTQNQLLQFAKNEIDILFKFQQERTAAWHKAEKKSSLLPLWTSGADNCSSAVTFGFDVPSMHFMGISNETDIQIILRTIDLECSEDAKTSLFVFRGSIIENDNIFNLDSPNEAHSLSFGHSLFAFFAYDVLASAFYYMRKTNNDAYSIQIAYSQLNQSAISIPRVSTVEQLLSQGEVNHPRTFIWHDCDKNIKGFSGSIGSTVGKQAVRSKHDKETLVKQFDLQKKRAILLKPKVKR